MKGIKPIWTIIGFLSLILTFEAKTKLKTEKPENLTKIEFKPIVEIAKKPQIPNISTVIPAYLNYSDIINQIKEWEKEAPDLVETGFYGKTQKGLNIGFLKICNKLETKKRPIVMITAAIHGNEPWSTGCVMACAGTILNEYGKNEEITNLVDSREIYIIPVVSPDSYPYSRYVDGVDPNRDFPGPNDPNHKSKPSISSIQDFFLKIKPNAVISGHTFGRVFLTPYGDSRRPCENKADYDTIIGKMSKLSNYGIEKACEKYGTPIYGSESDWYYRNGAFSVVMEFGTHQKIPSDEQINNEFNRTWESIKLFIKDAPLVEINSNNEYSDFSGNKGISHEYFQHQQETATKLMENLF